MCVWGGGGNSVRKVGGGVTVSAKLGGGGGRGADLSCKRGVVDGVRGRRILEFRILKNRTFQFMIVQSSI